MSEPRKLSERISKRLARNPMNLSVEDKALIQNTESLEVQVAQLQVKADKFDQIKNGMDWLGDPSGDIILMEINTYRQCARDYKEKKDVTESRLRAAQELIEKWRKVNLSNGFDDLIGHNIETTYEICADELEATLGG